MVVYVVTMVDGGWDNVSGVYDSERKAYESCVIDHCEDESIDIKKLSIKEMKELASDNLLFVAKCKIE